MAFNMCHVVICSYSKDTWEMAQHSDTLIKILKFPNFQIEGRDSGFAKMTQPKKCNFFCCLTSGKGVQSIFYSKSQAKKIGLRDI